jgi:hypothetical protein
LRPGVQNFAIFFAFFPGHQFPACFFVFACSVQALFCFTSILHASSVKNSIFFGFQKSEESQRASPRQTQASDEQHWRRGQRLHTSSYSLTSSLSSHLRLCSFAACESAQYDASASTFSPDGRIFQVEYANKAVENSGFVSVCLFVVVFVLALFWDLTLIGFGVWGCQHCDRHPVQRRRGARSGEGAAEQVDAARVQQARLPRRQTRRNRTSLLSAWFGAGVLHDCRLHSKSAHSFAMRVAVVPFRDCRR